MIVFVGGAPESARMNMNARIWVEQCDAARLTEDEFGVPKAIEYLVG